MRTLGLTRPPPLRPARPETLERMLEAFAGCNWRRRARAARARFRCSASLVEAIAAEVPDEQAWHPPPLEAADEDSWDVSFVCVCVCVCACVRARALARHGEEGSEAAGGAQAHARACVETLMQNGALSLPTEPAAPYTPTQACPELRRSRRRC